MSVALEHLYAIQANPSPAEAHDAEPAAGIRVHFAPAVPLELRQALAVFAGSTGPMPTQHWEWTISTKVAVSRREINAVFIVCGCLKLISGRVRKNTEKNVLFKKKHFLQFISSSLLHPQRHLK